MISDITIIFVLLCCSAFFSGSETAIFSLSRVEFHRLMESGTRSSKNLIAALKKPRETIVTILLGNEFVNVSISIVAASLINKMFRSSVEIETFVSVLVITPVVLIFGEILPKNISLRHAMSVSQVVIWPLRIFHYAVSPLRVILSSFADFIVNLFGGQSATTSHSFMEADYRRLVDMGQREGAIDSEESEMIHNVFEFTDKVVADILTPADRVFSLPVDVKYESMLEKIRTAQFSRIPFYEGDKSNIVGIFHVRDLMSIHSEKKSGKRTEIKNRLHPALFASSKMPLEDLLREFQRAQLHMAIVKDDSGNIVGLVTMDDLLEELFGEIED
ncbi:MAG: Hemolysin C [bacterium ADurb.Bin270]|jgi:CBS domain containing-hemolysin-like protein|nr:HlyC/CorC family transporter [Myxococcales bacterium]OQA61034.1 MAG: Hemolysin C [bacterium ADurb.Bin270]HQC50765.1 hemolysin family protein [bacterium]HQG12772.1 hemolysin family protein [bacterium]